MNTPEEHDGSGTLYEGSDAEPRPLLFAGLVLVVLILVSFGIGAWMLGAFERESAEDQTPNPLASYEARPEGPRLQANPKEEIDAYRAEMHATLTTYGWVDKENKIVRVPIERAMELLLQKGLPTRPDPVDPTATSR